MTRELKEQSILLQATRAELQRLKQPPLSTAAHVSSSFPSVTPPPALTPLSVNEKKQSNNVSTETQQTKRRQLEDLIKKVCISRFLFVQNNFIFLSKIGTTL